MLIHEKILAILSDSDAIAKDRTNTQQNFKFRGIDDVYNALHPLLAKHGVFSTTQVMAERSEERQSKNGGALIYRILTVKFTFYAADGSCVESIITGEGMDSGDKASNKAMAIAHKYALLQLLAIPTEDAKDPDAESHDLKPKAPAKKPLDAQNPIGKTPDEGMKQRAKDIFTFRKTPKDEITKVLAANKGTLVDGKWTNVDWSGVLNTLNATPQVPDEVWDGKEGKA